MRGVQVGVGRGACPGNAATVTRANSSSVQGRLCAVKCSFPAEKGAVRQWVTEGAGPLRTCQGNQLSPRLRVLLLSQICVFPHLKSRDRS